MNSQQSSKSGKFIALLGGVFFACLLCGTPLFCMVWTGRFRQIAQPFAYAAQTSVAMPVLSDTPMPLSEGAAAPTIDLTSQPFGERFDLAGDDISEALIHSRQGEYAEAIVSWNKALEIVPDFAGGYYNRGNAYLGLLNNQRSQEEYMHYLSLAGADFDKAIELDPSKGDYYYSRFRYYDGLSSNQTTRADSDHLELIALDNLLMANRLGSYQKDVETKLALVYTAVGKCDEAIEQANRLIAETADPTVDMIGSLAMGYLCKNDLPNALKYMNQAVERLDSCSTRLARARVFYAMDKLDDAMADLNHTIDKSPYYCGMRYYLRGLIYAEKGDLEKAKEDLNFGMGQTWERGGLLSYAQGKIALAQGDKESAIQLFQDAEATYPLHDPILLKVQADLAALGALPLEVTPSFPVATAISIPTPLMTPRPTSSPDPAIPTPAFTPDPRLPFATVVDIEKEIGPIQVGPNYDGMWRFQPAQSLDHREVQRLSVWLISSDTSQRLPRQISLWNFRNNMWGGNNEVHWGENQIDYPNEYVSPDGDIYIHLAGDNPTLEALIDKLGVTLIIQRTNGSIEVHGITP